MSVSIPQTIFLGQAKVLRATTTGLAADELPRRNRGGAMPLMLKPVRNELADLAAARVVGRCPGRGCDCER